MTQENKDWEKKFEELDVHISNPRSVFDEEAWRKYKLVLPMAWELFKPSVKSFIQEVRDEAIKEEREKYSKSIATLVKVLERHIK